MICNLEKDGFIGGLKKICPSYEEVSVEEVEEKFERLQELTSSFEYS